MMRDIQYKYEFAWAVNWIQDM